VLGALHDFDMQSSGGSAGALALLLTHGVLVSFLDALRSLAEQVALSVRLIIGGVSTLVDIALMIDRVCGWGVMGALCTITIR
jgi:hypothetical protein